MATKGPSNQYGNSRGGYSRNNPTGVNYKWASSFKEYSLNYHFNKHGGEVSADSKSDYVQKAIKFANTVDKKNNRAYVDKNGSTYKFNKKTKELVIVDKNGIIITYYKVDKGFSYTNKRGVEKWIKA